MRQPLTTADVDRIAALAHLALTDDARHRYAAQLERILDYAGQLSELDTTAVPVTASVQDEAGRERADEPRPSLDRADALGNAPESVGGLFRVPGHLPTLES